jgi:uncharacterized repeat protein (TIGR02543 family)
MAYKQLTGKYVSEYARIVEAVGNDANGETLKYHVSGHAIGQNVKRLERGEEYNYSTGANSWIIFYVYDYTSGNFRAHEGFEINNRNFIKLGPNSKLKITTAKGKSITDWDGDDKTFELLSGTLWQDKEAGTLKTVQDTIKTLVKTLNKGAVRTIVDGCKAKAGNNKDTLANLAIGAATSEAAITTFVLGLGGALVAIPAGAADMVAQWIYQAQVAYALGYVYGVYPQKDSTFENHLLILLAGQDALHEALKDDLDGLKKDSLNPLKNGLADIGAKYLEKKPQLVPKIVSKCLAKLGEKFASKAGQIVNKVISWVPFAASVWGVVSSGWNAIKFGGEAKEFYSKPVPEAATVTVKYDANGGTPSPADKAITVGSNYSLPTVSRPGYKFDGWYTAATGGTKVEGTTKVSSPANHTLYARWTGNTVTVTFHRNGGTSGSIPSISTVYNSRVTLPTPPTRPDFTFESWNTKPDGTGTAFNANTPVTADIAVHAKWKAVIKAVTINFDASGGTPAPASKTINSGSPYQLPSVTKPGYTLVGWFTQANGGSKIEPSSKVTGTCTLYARWTVKNIRVTFNAAGGTPTPPPRDIPFGSAYGSLPNVSRDKYTFQGWFTSGGAQVSNGTTVTDPNNHTISARWTAIPQTAPAPKPAPAPVPNHTVTFHRNNAPINAIPQKTAAHNSRITLPSPPVWPGHTFVGWNTNANGSGTAFTGNTPVTADIGVWAIWK